MVNVTSLNLLVFKVTVGVGVGLILFDGRDGLINARQPVESVLCPCRNLPGHSPCPAGLLGEAPWVSRVVPVPLGSPVRTGTLRNFAVLL